MGSCQQPPTLPASFSIDLNITASQRDWEPLVLCCCCCCLFQNMAEVQSYFLKITPPLRNGMKIATHVRLAPAGLPGCHLPIPRHADPEQFLCSRPNQAQFIRIVYTHLLFLLLQHDPWKKPWVGRGLCFILWLTENNWERFPVSISLPPCLCLPLLTYTRASTHTPSYIFIFVLEGSEQLRINRLREAHDWASSPSQQFSLR